MPDREKVEEITRRLFKLNPPVATEVKERVKVKTPENKGLVDLIRRYRERTRGQRQR